MDLIKLGIQADELSTRSSLCTINGTAVPHTESPSWQRFLDLSLVGIREMLASCDSLDRV
jgi:hypothetical protein